VVYFLAITTLWAFEFHFWIEDFTYVMYSLWPAYLGLIAGALITPTLMCYPSMPSLYGKDLIYRSLLRRVATPMDGNRSIQALKT
jgi:hypothetical protein